MIHLDTNIVIALLNGRPAHVRDRLRTAIDAGAEISISTIVIFELRYGADRSTQVEANHARLETFLAGPVAVLPFTAAAASHAGAIRAELKGQGAPIGPYDLLIAGHARAERSVLATANVREFARVSDLAFEDWTEEF